MKFTLYYLYSIANHLEIRHSHPFSTKFHESMLISQSPAHQFHITPVPSPASREVSFSPLRLLAGLFGGVFGGLFGASRDPSSEQDWFEDREVREDREARDKFTGGETPICFCRSRAMAAPGPMAGWNRSWKNVEKLGKFVTKNIETLGITIG